MFTAPSGSHQHSKFISHNKGASNHKDINTNKWEKHNTTCPDAKKGAGHYHLQTSIKAKGIQVSYMVAGTQLLDTCCLPIVQTLSQKLK